MVRLLSGAGGLSAWWLESGWLFNPSKKAGENSSSGLVGLSGGCFAVDSARVGAGPLAAEGMSLSGALGALDSVFGSSGI